MSALLVRVGVLDTADLVWSAIFPGSLTLPPSNLTAQFVLGKKASEGAPSYRQSVTGA